MRGALGDVLHRAQPAVRRPLEARDGALSHLQDVARVRSSNGTQRQREGQEKGTCGERGSQGEQQGEQRSKHTFLPTDSTAPAPVSARDVRIAAPAPPAWRTVVRACRPRSRACVVRSDVGSCSCAFAAVGMVAGLNAAIAGLSE